MAARSRSQHPRAPLPAEGCRLASRCSRAETRQDGKFSFRHRQVHGSPWEGGESVASSRHRKCERRPRHESRGGTRRRRLAVWGRRERGHALHEVSGGSGQAEGVFGFRRGARRRDAGLHLGGGRGGGGAPGGRRADAPPLCGRGLGRGKEPNHAGAAVRVPEAAAGGLPAHVHGPEPRPQDVGRADLPGLVRLQADERAGAGLRAGHV
mmetsp:Transcript_71697/g.144308  ORF Transcript_71697/g.144308 Transcript_71697/m.144308 type:complete len:209 (+) Transcript_71697:216-842(+)